VAIGDQKREEIKGTGTKGQLLATLLQAPFLGQKIELSKTVGGQRPNSKINVLGCYGYVFGK